jgi:hypothetical protein
MFRSLATLFCGSFSADVSKHLKSSGGGSGTRFREFQLDNALDQQSAKLQLRKLCICCEFDPDLSV